jgi:hypothetical protein
MLKILRDENGPLPLHQRCACVCARAHYYLQCVVCTACVNCGGVSGRGRRRRVWRPHACRQRIVTCNMRDMLAQALALC